MNPQAILLFTMALDTPAIPSPAAAETAIQYGPFFFALLFLVGGAAWTYNNYRAVCMRKNPHASPSEKATCQRIFVGTCVVGVVLVACCVVWWWLHRPGTFIFSGEIRGLHDYEKITSTELFFKRIQVPQLGPRVPGLRDEQFIAVQSNPFKQDDTFRIWFSKSDDNQEEFGIKYTAGTPRLKVEWSESEGKNVLQEISETKKSSISFPGVVTLEAAQQAKKKAPAQPSPAAAQPARVSVNPNLVEALQDERSQVGTKINILDKLLTLNLATLRAYVTFRTPKEPVAVTLVDLARHGDRELAFKAQQVQKKADLEGILMGQLTSADKGARDAATQTLYHMETPRAVKILDGAGTGPAAGQLSQVKRQIVQRPGLERPIPTGSPSGDRYYLKINWNPANPESGRCVANSFIADPPVEAPAIQPDGIPVDKELLVFWYSKDAASAASARARSCGAGAQFFSPTPIRRLRE